MITDPGGVPALDVPDERGEVAGDGKVTGMGGEPHTDAGRFSGGRRRVEIVEWNPGAILAWTSIIGIDQPGRWRLRDRPHGRTRVEFRPVLRRGRIRHRRRLAEIVAAPTVRGHLKRSLQQLKRQVEQEQLRKAAAARRAARTASGTWAAHSA